MDNIFKSMYFKQNWKKTDDNWKLFVVWYCENENVFDYFVKLKGPVRDPLIVIFLEIISKLLKIYI